MRVPIHKLLIAALPLLRDWLHGLLRGARFRVAPPFAATLAVACLVISPVGSIATAQEADDAAQEQEDEDEEEGEDVEVVTVTGSRLKRDTYTSISPLQIISAEVSREAGLVDAAEIVQQSTASAGVQVDLTFHTYVNDDGPGAVTANLRGLSAARTLVLINGRRVAPAGVEGAPQSPSLDIIPSLLVSSYDQLLDGASSIYGSDAVAGVINAVLVKDFDGLQFDAFPRFSEHGAGREDNLGLRWGRNFDRGFIGMGAQYSKIEPVTLADRPWTAGCNRHWEIDEAGRIRHRDLWYPNNFGMEIGECRVERLGGRVIVPQPIGSVYFTPGSSNGGWRNFSESSLYGFGVDGNGDGTTDVNFRDYSLNGRNQTQHMRPERTAINVMAYGEYTFEGEANITPYFELLYSNRQVFSDSSQFPIFPIVPARNPFNLCNPEGQGVDCGLAQDALFTNPHFVRQFQNRWADFCNSVGRGPADCTPTAFGLLPGEIGPATSQPVVYVQGDRTQNDSDITQLRYVGGVRGDLPMLNIGPLYDWTFDVSIAYSASDGTASRPGIREDRLDLALGWYSQDNTPCEANISDAERQQRGDGRGRALLELVGDSAGGCVPVNLFAPSLYAGILGDFNSSEERNYVFDTRDFQTEYMQTLFSVYLTGTLFDLPSGPVNAGFGIEYRIDEIASIPDQVARDGLFWGFFSDGGAEGEKYTREAFGEVEVPLMLGGTAATVNLSGRYTEDEFYGGAYTGAVKLGWNPVNSLLLRATYGTSYRAPALRELFLRDQTGFNNLFDPCLVPDGAINDLTDEYDPNLDQRDPVVLRNCAAQGIDPTIASNGGFNTYSVEQAFGGALGLEEETSESLSAGFVWEQPFTNAFDLVIGASYYDISISDTIIEPSGQFIINDCYNSETGNSPFCSRIRRNADPTRPLINFIHRGFINRDNQTRRGVDVNLNIGTTVRIVDQPIELAFDFVGHRQIEASDLFVNDEGVEDFFETQREWFFPEHKAQMGLRATMDRWSVAWRTRLHGRAYQEPTNVDAFSDIDDSAGTGFTGDTCLGPPADVRCRDLADLDDYWVHNASAQYRADTWNLRFGASNVFDTPPPQLDSEAWFTINNAVRAGGYDLLGRMFFLGLFIDIGGS